MAKEKIVTACQDGCCGTGTAAVIAPPPMATGCSGGCCCSGEMAVMAAETAATVDGAHQINSTFDLDGLDCGDCAAKLEKGINRIKGVIDAKVNFAAAKMKVTYDGSVVQPADLVKAVSGFGYQATLIKAAQDHHGFHRTVYRVSGLDCGDCAAKLEKKLAATPGIRLATVNFGAGKMTVEHTLSDSAILRLVEQAGYKAEREDKAARTLQAKAAWWKNTRTIATMVSGALLLVATVLEWVGTSEQVLIPLFALTAVIGGYNSAKTGLYGLRSWTFDMNFLMTFAVIGAAIIGEWGEAATVAFLFSFGNTLQTYTMDKTRQSIRALMELAPPEALVRRDGQELQMLVEDIVLGDTIIVKPGERIAMDGVVKSGASAVNQATITGESVPVEKTAGDSVYAGTVNEHGVLEIEVTKVAADSTLAKIMHLVEEAQAQKAPSQQFVDVFAKYYTPAVLLAALGVMVVPWLAFGQPFAPWFYKGLVLLVISCPCALVISTPVSIVSAIGNASRRGVLIKGGAYLEQMGGIKAMAFDKTGTLTHGRPAVTDILPANGMSEAEFLALAAAIEKWSEHPLAKAIVTKAQGISLKQVENFKALVGRGAQADLDGKTIYIGNLRLFEELGHGLAQYEPRLAELEQQGRTVMLMGAKDSLYGMIAVADTLRENSKDAIKSLRASGMRHIAMLTGDNNRVAGSIAGRLELDSFYSELLPEDKVAAVKSIAREYGNVVMVGDGVNDAPALAAATVGVAMGVAGSDTALETADIALMADDLGKLAYAIKLSRKTVAIIKQNISFSIIVKVIFVIATFLGMVNLWLAVFADMGASILVTLNGMRLMRKIKAVGNGTGI
ncbi:heavy metal translocating P-type ATPase [Anaeroselena agilis]|uniref:Cd(2+)-exporting ATPase n=1 Tax=Anaeroselena agilis TaxID=3063788 RepID=A0ABU3NX86_9FIRM|nr:heavy metal translocating P-type ATPase [Selenomonadales bacterium 4137-cl]